MHKPYNFLKNCARDPPLRGNYVGKIPNFLSFGAINPHPEPIKVKFSREEREVLTLIGAKPKNRPVS